MRRMCFVSSTAACLLAVLWASAVAAQEAAAPPTEPNRSAARPAVAGPSGTRALLLIQSDPDTFVIDAQTISVLLYTWHSRRDVTFQPLSGGSPGNTFGVLLYSGKGDGTKTLETLPRHLFGFLVGEIRVELQ